MYVIRNKALDDVYAKFNTHDLYSLSADQLELACEMLNVRPEWNTVERGGTTRRTDINRQETLNLIDSLFSYDIYIDQNYWSDSQLKLDTEVDLIGQLKNHITGRETFDLMSKYKLGISALKPDQSQEVDAPKDWLADVLGVSPLNKFLEIKNKDTGQVIGFDITKNEKGMVTHATIVYEKSEPKEEVKTAPKSMAERLKVNA